MSLSEREQQAIDEFKPFAKAVGRGDFDFADRVSQRWHTWRNYCEAPRQAAVSKKKISAYDRDCRIEARYARSWTVRQLASDDGLTTERVRQILKARGVYLAQPPGRPRKVTA